ncbi:ABC transporter ATP-binding protein [uncultured Hymenobacter sp.]|uniref:ABC transporter ATP-binding protein n=1 Tax=uncultured Hymenobacter sp. TaxID=170016 RepID=UPI0035CA56AD
MDLLTVSGVSLLENGHAALQPLSFAQRQGQKLALAGESGAGKSTLLQIIAGLTQPSTGEVRIGGERVRGPHETLVPGHPGVAYLSQKSDLPRSLRVEQVLRYASKRSEAEAQTLYELCHISHLLARRTDQLSGGEQQRVALARLLLGAPKLLLLDEPFSNLDRPHKRVLQTIIEELSEQLGITCLLVSHDGPDLLAWADDILVLHRGQLVQQGPPAQIYRQPVSEYAAGLFGDYSLVQGVNPEMLVPSPTPLPAGEVQLVRPEEFRLGPAGSGGVAGTVRAVRFFGSYCELAVKLPESIIRVRTDFPTPLAVDDVVQVAVVANGGWRLPTATT